MKCDLTLSGEFHEGFHRRFAEFRCSSERHFVFPKELQCEQTCRIGGWIGTVQLSRFHQVLSKLHLHELNELSMPVRRMAGNPHPSVIGRRRKGNCGTMLAGRGACNAGVQPQ